MLLEEQGFNVILLEAADHVGGRVQTRTFGGVRHELGASDIGVMYARVLDMMRRLNLERVPSAISIKPYSYHVRGQLLKGDEWEASNANQTSGDERTVAPSRLQSHLLGQFNPLEISTTGYSLSITIWIFRSLNISGKQGCLRRGDPAVWTLVQRYRHEPDFGAVTVPRYDAHDSFGIKAFMAMKQAGQKVAPLSQVAGGNQRLPDAMAASLKTEIRFGKAAAAIDS